MTGEDGVAGPRSRPLIDGPGSGRHLFCLCDTAFELRRGQASRYGVPFGRVEVLSLVQNFIASLGFRRRIVGAGVGIDFVATGVQVDRPDMQRLMNIADIVREYTQRFSL